MTTLAQIVAIDRGTRTRTGKVLTDAYHRIQRTPQLTGISRTYRPVDDADVVLPSEQTLVQEQVPLILQNVAVAFTRMFDVVATKDEANCQARADIVIDGEVLVSQVPVSHLLWLEKQMVDLGTFLLKLPTLDPAESWIFDANRGCYVSEVSQTKSTKKVMRNHVLHPGTDKHPPQVQTFTDDVVVGFWSTTRFAGALPADSKAAILSRFNKLVDAIKQAREKANSHVITDVREGSAIFDFLFLLNAQILHAQNSE